MQNLRLLKVEGYYNYEKSFDFSVSDSWIGYVILREDLTFEGIVNDKGSEDTDRLISGTLAQYNGASLMKFTNGGFCPCSFYGMSTGKEILGTWALHDTHFVTEQGRCKIIFSEASVEDSFMTDLESRINSFKADMSNYTQNLYDSLIENMNCTVQQFLQNLEIDRENIEAEIGTTLKKLEL